MKKIVLLFIAFIFSASGFCQAPAWLWAKSARGTSQDYLTSVATDINGNVFVTGYFEGATIIFGTDTLTNTPPVGYSDIFLAKYDGSGNVLWAKSMGGTLNDFGQRVSTDVSGNVFITGNFESPSMILGTDTLTNAGGGGDIFLVKYDGSGNVLWTKRAGGAFTDVGLGLFTQLTVGTDILATGYFTSSSIVFGTDTLINTGNGDVFLVKYDNSGNVIWAKSAAGNNGDYGLSVFADANDNAFITGYFGDSLTIGNDTLISVGVFDIFIAKYDNSGNAIWAKREGGSSVDYGRGVGVDANSNIFLTGTFQSTVTFGVTTLTSVGNNDVFVVKYDSSGNVLWAKRAGSNWGDAPSGISIPPGGTDAIIAGTFTGTSIIFGNDTLTNASTTNYGDIFIVRYSGSGNVLWAKRAGGLYNEQGMGISTDGSNNIIVGGNFSTSPFILGTDTLTPAGGHDIFVAKLDNITSIEDAPTPHRMTILFPNPATSELVVSSSELGDNTELTIYNTLGEKVFHSHISNLTPQISVDVSQLSSGIYFVKVKTDERISAAKFVKE